MTKKTRIYFILLFFLALIALSGYFGFGFYIRKEGSAFLQSYGFKNPVIGNTSFQGPFIALENIRLDDEGFSTIKSIRSKFPTLKDDIVIDDLFLTGEIGSPNIFKIEGWSPKSFADIPRDNITLDNGRLDLLTPDKGSIRLEAKGLTAIKPDGMLDVRGIVWGTQHQLTIETRWQGQITPTGLQNYNIEISKGRVNLDYLEISRMNGWANLKWTPGQAPELGGQLEVGKMTLAGNTLLDGKVTFNGPTHTSHIILNAVIPNSKNMILNADIKKEINNTAIDATITADQYSDLRAFLTQVRENVNQSTWGIGIFMPLLLTQGNLDRIESDMRKIDYDRLELSIHGSLQDLTGKIIAIKEENGKPTKHIISMDPGFAN